MTKGGVLGINATTICDLMHKACCKGVFSKSIQQNRLSFDDFVDFYDYVFSIRTNTYRITLHITYARLRLSAL